MRDSGFHPFNGRVSRHFGDSLKADDAYLSYHDIRLMKEDIDTLRDDWLTDNCIAFWEEYLEREYLTQHPNAQIVLLRPSMSFMLTQTPDPVTIRDALPDFTHTTHIFLPLTDCRNPAIAEGGSHWSLLVVSIVDGSAFHYDSLFPSNSSSAELAVTKLSKLLGRELMLKELEDAPQQHNSSDCGVFVCIIMKHLLLGRLLKAARGDKISMHMSGKGVNAAKGRRDMLETIEAFRKEGERRRSRSSSPFAKGHSRSKSPPRID